MQDHDELLTRAEAADYLNLHPDTLASWVYRGKPPGMPELPYVKLGRKYLRYRRSDLDRFIAAGLTSTAAV